MASLTVAVGGAAARDGNLGLLVGSVNPHHEVQRTKEVHNSQVSSDSTESPTIAKIRNINTDMDMDTDTEINMDTDMDTETDEQVFIKSPHLEIVAPWLAYRREGVYYFAYHEAYADVAFIALLEQEEMMLYSYRGKHIKRAPKREYYIPGQKPPTYVWGQQIKNRPGGEEFTGLPMPDWMVSLKNKINCDFNVQVNHAIIIKYSDGVKNHAPPHQDKIPAGTGFFVLSFGEPRKFQMSFDKTDNSITWNKHLASGSLLHVTNIGNKRFFHAVPPDPTWSGKARYSLIFRTIF